MPQARPVGIITVHDQRGYAYIPKVVRNEVGLNGKGEIPFYLDANCVLLLRRGAIREDVLKGLEILREDLELRWKQGKDAATKLQRVEKAAEPRRR